MVEAVDAHWSPHYKSDIVVETVVGTPPHGAGSIPRTRGEGFSVELDSCAALGCSCDRYCIHGRSKHAQLDTMTRLVSSAP